jgi:hypothetical protein
LSAGPAVSQDVPKPGTPPTERTTAMRTRTPKALLSLTIVAARHGADDGANHR